MHWGQCTGVFNRSVNALSRALSNSGGRLLRLYVGNESLVQRARNTIGWHFMQEDAREASHLLFCDSDQGFEVEDIALMVKANKPIIVAPTPMKQINWRRVAKAVQDGVPPEELHRYTGFFNIVPLRNGEARIASKYEPFEIERGGAGLMLIERNVFDELANVTETYINRCPGDAMPPGVRVHNFFPTPVVDDDLLSEDFGFCNAWRKIGGTIWAAPWCRVEHVGAYTFRGCYADQYAVERAAAPAAPADLGETCRSERDLPPPPIAMHTDPAERPDWMRELAA